MRTTLSGAVHFPTFFFNVLGKRVHLPGDLTHYPVSPPLANGQDRSQSDVNVNTFRASGKNVGILGPYVGVVSCTLGVAKVVVYKTFLDWGLAS